MPELTICRKNTAPPPVVCMYCGEHATSMQEWREVNHKPGIGGGGNDLSVVPVGDDPISAVIAILLLPLALWQLLVALVSGLGAVAGLIKRPPLLHSGSTPEPRPQPTTLVVVTTCDRHRLFHRRFWWAWLGAALVSLGLWTWAIAETRKVMGTENVDFAVALVVIAVLATAFLPIGVGTLRFLHGPVIVGRVTESSVVLDRVRQAYFDATGLKSNNAT